MRPHLPEDELHAYIDGELSVKQRSEIARHLLGCTQCKVLLAETLELKDQASRLLGHASPFVIHRRSERPQPAVAAAPGRWLRRRLPLMAAGIGTILVAGSYLRGTGSGPFGEGGLREAFVAPFGLGSDKSPTDLDSTSGFRLSERVQAVAATIHSAPTVTAIAGEAQLSLQPATYIADPMEQQLAGHWRSVPVEVALVETKGAIPRLIDLKVNEIRVLESALGARPTLLSRYILDDGRSVWLAEGAEEELESVQQMLLQNGYTVSNPKRTRPDYITTEEGTRRTNRLVIVASTVSSDSVNALLVRVK